MPDDAAVVFVVPTQPPDQAVRIGLAAALIASPG
jgi:hypothetical protein